MEYNHRCEFLSLTQRMHTRIQFFSTIGAKVNVFCKIVKPSSEIRLSNKSGLLLRVMNNGLIIQAYLLQRPFMFGNIQNHSQ